MGRTKKNIKNFWIVFFYFKYFNTLFNTFSKIMSKLILRIFVKKVLLIKPVFFLDRAYQIFVGEAVNSVECGTVIEVDEGEDFIVVQGSNKSDEVKVSKIKDHQGLFDLQWSLVKYP